MIKRLLFLFVVLSISFQISAQTKFEREWNIGVGFGPTFSTMSIVPTNTQSSLDTKSLNQFHGGISVRYMTENHLGLLAELNYSQQGWESVFDAEGDVESTFKHTHKLNYIELPLLTHIYFGSKKFRYFINLGPKFGYLLSEKQEMNSELQTWIDTEYNEDTGFDPAVASYSKSSDKKIDYGILAGMGFEIRTGIGNFALEGRYYMGFGDIYKNSKRDEYSRSANRVFSARLTYFIKAF